MSHNSSNPLTNTLYLSFSKPIPIGRPLWPSIFRGEWEEEEEEEAASSGSKNGQTFPLKSDLPFDFKYSYSETNPSVEPIGFREPPRFSPFGPGRLDRKWTGTCALAKGTVDSGKLDEERNAVLGEPLSEEEVALLVERYRHSDCSRQINLGTLSLSTCIFLNCI